MNHVEHMKECLRLARRGAGRVSPNPMVGAVLVRRGRVIARGYHHFYGGPHAEIECLSRASGDLSAASLYVNLEPCVHHGKTPPCVDAIKRSGVGRVVIAMEDPNPLVAGKGIRSLRRSGIEVIVGVLGSEARSLNRMFIRYISVGRPFVHLKVAQSSDGFIAPPRGRRVWLTSVRSRRLVHRWRAEHDAVLVGAGTIIADDPALDVRHVEGRSPLVAILDGRLRTPAGARVFHTGSRVIIFCAKGTFERSKSKARALVDRGAVIIGLPSKRGRVSLGSVLRFLFKANVGSVLVEGGAQVFSAFAEEGLIDQLSIFAAPQRLGKGLRAFDAPGRLGRRDRRRAGKVAVSSRRVGRDVLLQLRFS
jgi:diaminohydroxyphosphoribosylaminopyrimidine deaminase / 5-amino-6-(5-phosphoribosylamino)uracil reductase